MQKESAGVMFTGEIAKLSKQICLLTAIDGKQIIY